MSQVIGPTKLKFMIQWCSGEDPDHPSRELLYHNSSSRGWQTPRFGKYPQELILKLERPAKLHQLQILSHEFKISSQVELYIGTSMDSENTFRRLGHFTFDNNQANNFSQREMKSVHLNEQSAQFIRLVFHRHHVNKRNIYNQVGVMAINIIGVPNFPTAANPFESPPLQEASPSRGPNYSTAAQVQMADMMLDVNVDPLTASKIRQLDQQKQAAVAREDYDQAKQMKIAIQKLTQMGVKIGQLERAKQSAVQKEDYDLAKQIKQDIDQLRMLGEQSILQNQPDINQQALPKPPQALPLVQQQHTGEQQNVMHGQQGVMHAKQQIDAMGMQVNPDLQQQEMYAQQYQEERRKSKQQEYDERPAQGRGSYFEDEQQEQQVPNVPAVQSQQQDTGKISSHMLDEVNETTVEERKPAGPPPPDDFPPPGTQPDLPEPAPLTENARQECEELIQLFGEYICQCWKAKQWQLRDAAIRYMEAQINKGVVEHEGDIRSVGRLAAGGLKDMVGFVTSSCLRLLETSMAALNKKGPTGQREVGHLVVNSLPMLVDMAGSSNSKMKEQAKEFLQFVVQKHKGLVPQMMPQLLKPVKLQTAWRPMLARLEVFECLLDNIQVTTNDEGFPVEPFMKFLGTAFTSPNKDVRIKAVKLVAEAGKSVGAQTVKRLLPSDINPKLQEQIDRQLGLVPAVAATTTKPTTRRPPPQTNNINSNNSTQKNQPQKVQNAPQTQNQGKEDVRALEDELKRLEKQYGRDHPTVSNTLANLAIIHSNKGDTKKALDAYKRALVIQEKHFGKDSQPVAHTLTDIAVIHLEEGRDDEGRPLLERALAIQESLLGPDHEDVQAIKEVLFGED